MNRSEIERLADEAWRVACAAKREADDRQQAARDAAHAACHRYDEAQRALADYAAGTE